MNNNNEYTVCIYSEASKEYLPVIRSAWHEIAQFDQRDRIEPHITISQARIPEEAHNETYETITNEIRSLNLKHLTFRFSRIVCAPHQPECLFLAINKNKTLYHDHHCKVVNILNKHRRGLLRSCDRSKINERFYHPDQIRVAQEYGYPHVMKWYKPHISLCKLKDVNQVKTIKQILNKKLAALLKKEFISINLTSGLFINNLETGTIEKLRTEKIKLIIDWD